MNKGASALSSNDRWQSREPSGRLGPHGDLFGVAWSECAEVSTRSTEAVGRHLSVLFNRDAEEQA